MTNDLKLQGQTAQEIYDTQVRTLQNVTPKNVTQGNIADLLAAIAELEKTDPGRAQELRRLILGKLPDLPPEILSQMGFENPLGTPKATPNQ